MATFSFIAFLGFLLGMRHATDPDHVIAVTTIVSRERGVFRAGWIGATWGLGHTLTIFLIGIAIIVFKVAIPVRLGLSMELAVGLMLVLLGVLNLTGILRRFHHRGTPQGRTQDGELPAREEKAFPDANFPRTSLAPRQMPRWGMARPLVVGIVHGMAGSAAVALLVMTTIADPRWEIAYLLIFGLGTVAGMMLITALISLPFAYATRRFSNWNHGIVYASGILSLCFGLLVTYQIGIVGGLFTDHPHWTPH